MSSQAKNKKNIYGEGLALLPSPVAEVSPPHMQLVIVVWT